MITTYDPRLTALGLSQYPALPGTTDTTKIEEIRRTIYIYNLDKSVCITFTFLKYEIYSHCLFIISYQFMLITIAIIAKDSESISSFCIKSLKTVL